MRRIDIHLADLADSALDPQPWTVASNELKFFYAPGDELLAYAPQVSISRNFLRDGPDGCVEFAVRSRHWYRYMNKHWCLQR